MPPDLRRIDLQTTLGLLAEMSGALCWGAKTSGDELLDFDVGDPYLWVTDTIGSILEDGRHVGTKVSGRRAVARGIWHFEVEDGQWMAVANDLSCRRTDSDAHNRDACVNYLNGQKLIDVAWDPDDRAWTFALDFGGRIEITAPLPEDQDGLSVQWVMNCRDRYLLYCVRDDEVYFADRRPRASAS